MGEQEEIDKLAESLHQSGLAASITDAKDKAKEILGYSNKGVKIRVEEPSVEKKEKVDSIINEVDKEIETKKESEKPVEKKLSQFDDADFNVADSNMKVGDLVKDEVMTNDQEILQQEEEAQQIEDVTETEESSETDEDIVKTNDEIDQEEENKEETTEEQEEPEEEPDEDRPILTKEEKDMTDLTKLFNPNK
ncbi:hypothetical protein CEE44_00440 [Candidatus Woesearchaeota archaeon B3_Woes]|nr:MAG: hypothetical protein CEE44_00440 [Candidatus Woesearchaeota archaeon B3_Woes]